ncbi:MAG: PD-(D/E)XK nuclease family protein [Dehalococcoidia bacterium]|nr:PD-(D/E)XK nuclease family protein [Dehalococcoidia bacterium]
MLTLRPSALDRIYTCAASAHTEDDAVLIDHEEGADARIGSAVHEILARMVAEGLRDVPDVEPVALAWGVSADEIRWLCYRGREFLDVLRPQLSESPEVEQPFEISLPGDLGFDDDLYILRGRADGMDYVQRGEDGIVHVWDYKTGERTEDARCRQQMLAYAAAGLALYRSDTRIVTEVVVWVAWLKTGERTVRRYDPAEVEAWAVEVPSMVEWDGRTYTPGDACRYCPRVAVCVGRMQLMATGVEVLTHGQGTLAVPTVGSILEPEKFGRAVMVSKILKKMLKEFDRGALTAVRLNGGRVELPSGDAVVIKQRAGDAKIDPRGLLTYLRDAHPDFTDDELAAMVKVSKEPLEKFISGRAPKGEKGKAIEAAMERLEEAGTLTRGAPVEWVDVQKGEQDAKE